MPILVLLFLGPTGSGKDVQAELLGEKLGLPVTGPGLIFREAFEAGTSEGRRAKAFTDKGHMVPNDLTFELVGKELGKEKYNKGFIVTGLVRDVSQIRLLDELLKRLSQRLDHVILLHIELDEVLKRLTARFHCQKCERKYNTIFMPSEVEGICDDDGTKLVQRDDDKPEAIKTRYHTMYLDTIGPIKDHYTKEGKLIEIDGTPPIEEVKAELWEKLGIK